MIEMKTLVFGIFVCFSAFGDRKAIDADDVHWTYYGIYGEGNWSLVYNVCDATTHYRQSPIDIVQKDAQYDQTLTPITLQSQSSPGDTITIVNNGHTVSFSYDQSAVRVHGGHLNGSFRVGGVHFHWGSSDSFGSEHRIDGKQYTMELHIVNYDETRYSGVLDASGGINSIAVLGVLFTVSSDDNPAFAPLLTYFKNVTIESYTVKMPYFDLSSLLPSNTELYFRYLGSLTTPPCSESVVWTVFKTTETISSRQMSEFRKLQSMVEPNGVVDYLSDNWRIPQPLDGRIVQSSFSGSPASFLVTSITRSIVIALAVVIAV